MFFNEERGSIEATFAADIKNFAENITDNTSFPSSVTPEKPKSFILTRIIRRSGTSIDNQGVPYEGDVGLADYVQAYSGLN